MIKIAANIYELIDEVYYVTKLFGMAPYTRKFDKNKKRIYTVSSFGLEHVLINGGVLLLMWVSAAVRVLIEMRDHTPSFIDCVDGGMFMFMHLAGTATMAFYMIRQNEFLQCLSIIEECDQIFKKLNTSFSYKLFQLIYYLLLAIYPIYLFIIITPVWKVAGYVQEEGFVYRAQALVFQGLSFVPMFFIRHTPLFYFCGFLIMAYQKFQKLNEYVLQKKVLDSDNYNFVSDVLSIIENLHYLLFQLTRNTASAFSAAMFFNLTITFLEFVSFFVSFKYSRSMDTFQVILGFILFSTGAFISLVCCEMIKSEAEKTKRVLCEMTLPYFNKELGERRKTIFLQMIHEKIELNASGFYNMDMQVLTSHVGTISTLLMFFLKLRDDLLDANPGGI